MEIDRRAILSGIATTIVSLTGSRAATKETVIFEARDGTLALQPGTETKIWGFNGQVPGPLLRIRRGDEVKVSLVNGLAQPTTLCWHGVRIINAMDGVGGLTQPVVAPGASFDYRFTPPDSGLFWVHPHVFPQSAEQIGRGLYGVLIVEELEPPKVDDELLVVIDDWALDAKGQIKDEVFEPEPPIGDRGGALVTVNAKPAPLSTTVRPGARLRLRLLNVCSGRIAIVGFDGLEATIIAIDSQPCEIFEPARATIPIGPGARFEVMVDVPREAGKVAQLVLRGEKETSLLVIRTKGEPVAPAPPVTKLPDNPLLPTRIPLERSLKRQLVIERLTAAKGGLRWSLGGEASDGLSDKPLFSVKRGEAVTLAFVNRSADPQQMHVHGHVFRLLHDLDDGWDPYWRDCLLLAPGKTKHVAFIADNPGKWAIESLILDRQVAGLAGWFEVG